MPGLSLVNLLSVAFMYHLAILFGNQLAYLCCICCTGAAVGRAERVVGPAAAGSGPARQGHGIRLARSRHRRRPQRPHHRHRCAATQPLQQRVQGCCVRLVSARGALRNVGRVGSMAALGCCARREGAPGTSLSLQYVGHAGSVARCCCARRQRMPCTTSSLMGTRAASSASPGRCGGTFRQAMCKVLPCRGHRAATASGRVERAKQGKSTCVCRFRRTYACARAMCATLTPSLCTACSVRAAMHTHVSQFLCSLSTWALAQAASGRRTGAWQLTR